MMVRSGIGTRVPRRHGALAGGDLSTDDPISAIGEAERNATIVEGGALYGSRVRRFRGRDNTLMTVPTTNDGRPSCAYAVSKLGVRRLTRWCPKDSAPPPGLVCV
jgi:hypothetical protein